MVFSYFDLSQFRSDTPAL